MGALPPGSYLALSDGTDTSPALNQAIAAYNQNAASSYHLRSPEQIASFFDGLTLVPPGVVTTSRWRPEIVDTGGEPREVDAMCGVGRKDRRRPARAWTGWPGLAGLRSSRERSEAGPVFR